jgi:hypothetical protein
LAIDSSGHVMTSFGWGSDMPVLSMFYGIIIRMFANEAKHNIPHIHVQYAEHKAVIGLNGDLIKGDPLPAKQMQILRAWMILHEDELLANWELLSNNEPYFKIRPLD